MKCPRCGFNSFAGLENCKKCGTGLHGFAERSAGADRSRRSREPVPADEPGQGAQSAREDATDTQQGELFTARREEAPEPEPFTAQIGEEFTAGPEPVDAPAAPPEREKAAGETDPSEGSDGESAEAAVGWRPRLLASVVDLLLLTALVGLFALCGNLVLTGAGETLADGPLLPYLPVAAAVCFAYFTFFHYLTGQSPGKMLFGLLVECREGGPLSFSRVFLRSFGGGFCLLGLGSGFAPILWRRDGCGWNDRIAGSCVVRLAGTQGRNARNTL